MQIKDANLPHYNHCATATYDKCIILYIGGVNSRS